MKTKQQIIENAVRLMTYWHNEAKDNEQFVEKAYQIAHKLYDDVVEKTHHVGTSSDWRTRGIIK